MSKAVKQRVRLSVAGKDGTARSTALRQVERQTGQKLFDRPEVPELGQYLWDWFWDLDIGRQNNGFGASHLSCQEIAAWASLHRHELEPWEVRTLRSMDLAFVEVLKEKRAS